MQVPDWLLLAREKQPIRDSSQKSVELRHLVFFRTSPQRLLEKCSAVYRLAVLNPDLKLDSQSVICMDDDRK